jgi:hypothetical protein
MAVKNKLRILALSIASFAVALLAGEAILRLIGYSSPSFHTSDAHLGFGLRPGAAGWWTEEGRAYVKINSDGMRDIEHSIQKPKGTIRIAILGDSYAEGRQLPIENLFWKVLEKEVRRCLPVDRSVEALNFGVSGYGTVQELLMLRTRVWKYEPDIVILAFLTGNDIRNNSKVLNDSIGQPYFVLEDDRLVLDNSYLQAPGFKTEPGWPVKLGRRFLNVRLVQLIREVRFQWFILPRMRVRGDVGEPLAEIGLDNNIYRPPTSKTWSEAWKVTEALIDTMAADVNAAGARFLVAILSNGSQVHPDPAVRQKFVTEAGIEDLFYPDRRILELARRKGIDAIALAPVLQQWAEEHETCVHGFGNSDPCAGHWNQHGHRFAGQQIAGKICRDFVSGAPRSLIEVNQTVP